jgi:hypothetical protein
MCPFWGTGALFERGSVLKEVLETSLTMFPAGVPGCVRSRHRQILASTNIPTDRLRDGGSYATGSKAVAKKHSISE